MNTITSASRLLRLSLLATVLAVLPVVTFANDSASDSASRLLTVNGNVPIKAAGPYVEVGTFRVQVAAKLGQPALRLADGSWLYRNFEVTGSDASGTLLVRFTEGRVSQLALVSPATVVALQAAPKQNPGRVLIAAQERR